MFSLPSREESGVGHSALRIPCSGFNAPTLQRPNPPTLQTQIIHAQPCQIQQPPILPMESGGFMLDGLTTNWWTERARLIWPNKFHAIRLHWMFSADLNVRRIRSPHPVSHIIYAPFCQRVVFA
jgi:hypothetical protein